MTLRQGFEESLLGRRMRSLGRGGRRKTFSPGIVTGVGHDVGIKVARVGSEEKNFSVGEYQERSHDEPETEHG